MKVIIGTFTTLAVLGMVLAMQEDTRMVLTSAFSKPTGAKTVKVAAPEEENEFARLMRHTTNGVMHLFGIERKPEKSELQKLMEKRRKETSQVGHFFSF